MAALTFGGGVVLTINPTMLTDSINAKLYFVHMASLAPQWFWRMMFLTVGTSRLIALTVNGSFPALWWMPPVRVASTGVSAILWAELALSVVGGPVAFGTLIYPSLFVVELSNVRQAIRESWGCYGRGRG